MNILIVEDTASEREKAHAAVEAAGHKVAPFNNATWRVFFQERLRIQEGNEPWWCRGIDGIITDLMFNPFDRPLGRYQNDPPPAGLLIVIQAMARGIPVVVCTDANGDHHCKEISWIHDTCISGSVHSRAKLPFGWNDEKNWHDAIKQLEERVNRSTGAG